MASGDNDPEAENETWKFPKPFDVKKCWSWATPVAPMEPSMWYAVPAEAEPAEAEREQPVEHGFGVL
jgi:hypothetical protein